MLSGGMSLAWSTYATHLTRKTNSSITDQFGNHMISIDVILPWQHITNWTTTFSTINSLEGSLAAPHNFSSSPFQLTHSKLSRNYPFWRSSYSPTLHCYTWFLWLAHNLLSLSSNWMLITKSFRTYRKEQLW
jgi:hypothetical protein